MNNKINLRAKKFKSEDEDENENENNKKEFIINKENSKLDITIENAILKIVGEKTETEENLINIFPSMSKAHKETGVSVTQIARAIHGEVNIANGFIWKEGSTTMREENPTSPVRNTDKIKIGEDIV